MKILLSSATRFEVKPLLERLDPKWKSEEGVFVIGGHSLEYLESGVGIHRTSYFTTRAIAKNRPDLCINCGIAGSFRPEWHVGQVVQVVDECIPELGAYNSSNKFLTLRDLGLHEDIDSYSGLKNTKPLQNGAYAFARGITVNTIHSRPEDIELTRTLFQPDIETMEGAAFFYVCIKENIPFYAFRSISNVVGPRDVERWDFEKAINALADALFSILNSF